MDLEQLGNKYKFTEIEKNILNFLHENIDPDYSPTIREVAKKCYTSPTTIIKLAKKMKLSGYTELLLKVKETSLSEANSDKHTFVSVRPTPEVEKKFVQLLSDYKDENIMIVASGFSQVVADYMNDTLLLNNFHSLRHVHLELLSMQKGKPIVIAVSESGETSSVKEIVSRAKDSGATVISFTGNPLSSISLLADLDISVRYFDIFSTGTNPRYFYGSTLIVFEFLMSSYKNSLH